MRRRTWPSSCSLGLLPAALAGAAALAGCDRRGPGPSEPDALVAGTAGPTSTRDDEYAMAYGAQTIVAYADPSLADEVARLFALFEDFARERVPIDASTRIPIGWTTLSFVVEGPRGERLVVREPDYANTPETQTRADISVSLATLARQRAVLEHAGVAGEAIDFDQHVLTVTGTLATDEVFLLRVESPGGRMTGWRLSPTEGIAEDAEIESLPVYAILAARPALLDAMLLPPGYMAFYSGDTLTTIVNERDEVVWDATLAASSTSAGTPAPPLREAPEPLLQPLD